MKESAQSVVATLLREHGPLTIDELLQLAKESSRITTKNPKQTIRNAVASLRSVEPGADGRYVYFPLFIEGAQVRVPLAGAMPGGGRLLLNPEASTLIWPDYFSKGGPTFSLANGPTVVLERGYHWPGNFHTIVQLPDEFWTWLEGQKGADALIVSSLDGEAGEVSIRATRAETLDAGIIQARNDEVWGAAAEILRRTRHISPGDLARRLLARGIFHRPIPPDPVTDLLLMPGSPFIQEPQGISYRPDITPAMWRLFESRLLPTTEWDEDFMLRLSRVLTGNDEGEIAEEASVEEEEWDIPEPRPLPVGGERQGYRLRVRLTWQPKVWRDLDIRGDQTLEELHLVIQHAFGWDNDHLYAFYLSGKAHDMLTEVGGTTGFGQWEFPLASEVVLAHLELKRGQKFLYLFDFGDDLRHDIEVIDTFPAEDGETYPRVVDIHGEAPPQYPEWNEWGG